MKEDAVVAGSVAWDLNADQLRTSEQSAGCGLQFEIEYGQEHLQQMMVLAQEQRMVDFEMVCDCYRNKVAQLVPVLLHSLMELGYLCLPKERQVYKGLFYAKFLCLYETERDRKKKKKGVN